MVCCRAAIAEKTRVTYIIIFIERPRRSTDLHTEHGVAYILQWYFKLLLRPFLVAYPAKISLHFCNRGVEIFEKLTTSHGD